MDALLLLGCDDSCVDSVEPLWREALALREECLAPVQFLPPLQAFGGKTEMHSTAELDAVITSKADLQYQSLIMNERCIGHLSQIRVLGLCVLVREMFRSSQYSEAKTLLKYIL